MRGAECFSDIIVSKTRQICQSEVSCQTKMHEFPEQGALADNHHLGNFPVASSLTVTSRFSLCRDLLDSLMQGAGRRNSAHESCSALCGHGRSAEALSKGEYRRPDLIFMDVQLPGENGLEITRKIKRVYSDIVVVILTSYGLLEHRQQAFQNGADCFLIKEDDTCMDNILARVEREIAR